MKIRSPVLVTYGGGVNSTALLVEMVKRSDPVDAIVFSDTGGETPLTYSYLEMFSGWLTARDYPSVTTVRYRTKEGIEQTLEENCRAWPRLPSIAYGFKTCSDRWKRRPQHNWCKAWPRAVDAWDQGRKVEKIIGYDADEPHRADRVSDDRRYRHRFPLIEWDMGREECTDSIRSQGLPVPPKSSCFFCPSMRKSEVLALAKNHPDLMARALDMESAAQTRGAIRGLGRDWAWSELLEADDRQQRLFIDPEGPPCGCWDGGE